MDNKSGKIVSSKEVKDEYTDPADKTSIYAPSSGSSTLKEA